MATNPLFPKFSGRLASAVGKWLQGTALGKFLDAQKSLRQSAPPGSSPRPPARVPVQQVRAAAKQLQQLANQVTGRPGTPTDKVRRAVLDELQRRGGPLGELVTAILRPNGKPVGTTSQEARAASNLIQQLTTGREVAEAAPPTLPAPTVVRPQMAAAYGDGPEMRVLGRRYRFAPDDPILTGEMIPVASSNVHSIGFLWNPDQPQKGTLKVRFLGSHPGGRRSGGGPLYFYHGVHPEVFQAFRVASSKGKFVWDRLRVRGTVSGHQYFYDLAGLQSNGYVPRKATRYGQNEYYIRRQVLGQNGQAYESSLPDELVRRVGMNRPPPAVIANRGLPNRGQPDRGGPNRGR